MTRPADTDDVVLVRMAAQCALGESLGKCVDRLQGSESGVRVADALEQQPRIHAGIGQVEMRDVDGPARAERLLTETLRQLLDDDAVRLMRADPSAVSAVLGTTLAGMRHCGEALRCEANGDQRRADAEFARMPAGAVMRAVIAELPIAGHAISISCACASALSALMHARSLLRSGAAQLVVAGGYDPISEFSYAGFSALQLVAAGPLSPFAPDREGMKLGEGCGLVLMCTAEYARLHNLRPIARMEAGGEASDAYHLTQPHPQGSGAATALVSATAHGLPNLLLAHGTGTPGNDNSEYAAYRAAFGDDLVRIPVSALKSRIGHPLGAAGALELILALGCAEAGFAPAGVGRPVDRAAFPELDLLHGKSRPKAPERIAVLAAGFGGANVAVSVQRMSGPTNQLASSATGSEQRIVAHRSKANVHVRIRAIGAVTAGGRGIEGLKALANGAGAQPPLDDTLAPLLDRAKTRRLALLPRLLLAAVRDLVESEGLASGDLRDVPLLAASWHGAAEFTERYYRDLLASGIDLANPMLFAESVPNIGSAHVSMGFGITAASATVVGTRTSGLEALSLAHCRIASGDWSHALVVAGDEVHPIVNRVLGHCYEGEIDCTAGAVALLLESTTETHGPLLSSVAPVPELSVAPETVRCTSGSACDASLRAAGYVNLCIPGLGGASGPAALALAVAGRQAGPSVELEVGCCNPGSVAWRALASTRTQAPH